MGYTTRHTNDKLAPALVKKSLTPIGRLLIIIGKPAFFLFSRALIGILFIAYITGYFTRVTLTNFFKFLINLIFVLFINLPRGLADYAVRRVPKVKIKQLKTLLGEKIISSKTILSGFFTRLSKNSAIVFKHITSFLSGLLGRLSKGFVLYGKKFVTFGIKGQALPGRAIQTFFFFFRLAKVRLIILAMLIFTISLIPPVFLFWKVIIKDLPSPRVLTERKVGISTKIHDRNGVLLYKIYKDQNRTLVKLSQIPPQVRLATLAIEDAEFYSHPGFSIRGILRALVKIVKGKEITGGSTITQQLVKNALLSPEKTLARKLKEVVLAIKVEKTFSKDEILEMYLNEVSYGGTAYGVQEAARVYFGRDVDKLTLAEAALLAGLPKSPTQYSPFTSNPLLAFERQKEVLHLMKVNGYINEEQERTASSEKITFAPNRTDIKAPHFVMYVRSPLEEKYGKEFVEEGGLEVITTLDYRIQTLAEKVVKEEVKKLATLNVKNAAVLVISPETGEVLAMVGSRDYFDIQNDGNVNVTTSLRQPGSSIKVVNYAYAFSNGFSPASIIADSPITFLVSGQPPYTPKNYEGGFRGNISLRSALAESRNVAAVKVLASYGVGKMIEMGQHLGITTWKNPSDYGLSLTLGGGDVRLTDLAKVYATIANYGRRPELSSILKVTDNEGKVLEQNACVRKDVPLAAFLKTLSSHTYATESSAAAENDQVCQWQEVLNPRVAYLLIDILRDNSARAPAFGANSYLVIPNHKEVAVKTGTSNDLRDNLTLGFTKKYLVAVWVGNNDASPMARIASGVTGAAPIFNKIMSALLASEESYEWEVPNGLVKLPICTLTGALPCEGCPTRVEWFLEENAPNKHCNPEYIKGLNSKVPNGEILEPAAQTGD